MTTPPRWIPIFFGAAMVLIAALILGAVFGVVPTQDGQFLAPRIIVAGLGVCLLSGGLAMWVPQRAPALVRSALFLVALGSIATVCNWTAFAPEVVYNSSTSIGPVEFSRQDQFGGRIVFGLVALAIDLFILSAIVGWARAWFDKKR